MKYQSSIRAVLLLASACAQAPVVVGDEQPVPPPGYTEQELADLANSVEVQHNLEPFVQVPMADASQ